MRSSNQLTSAKRTLNERSGIHSWHPYYGGFSELFVSNALAYLQTKKHDLVLDPWGGSGTTSLVSSRLGIRSISVEINPVIAAFSAAKSPFIVQNKRTIREFISTLADRVDSNSANSLLQYFVAAEKIGPHVSARHSSQQRLLLNEPPTAILVPPLTAFLRAAGFQAIRKNAGLVGTSNPTWIAKSEKHKTKARSRDLLLSEISQIANGMLSDLTSYYSESETFDSIHINNDCKSLCIASSSVSRIVTSPPYLTRIDYAVSTAPELVALGGNDLLKDLRNRTMGTTTITKMPKVQSVEWGLTCNHFLDEVANHESKAAKSYYWKNFVQYFTDVDSTLRELYRVMRRGGKGLIVVQNSYFKDVECELSKIYVEVAVTIGFRARVVFRDPVGRGMANVNTKSKNYGSAKTYFEDFVYIEKP